MEKGNTIPKFRAKNLYTTSWVYGFYVNHVDHETIYQLDKNGKGNFPCYVKGETLGQYAGLKDKNGKEIYEGDIVKISDDSEFWSLPCAVIWNEDYMCLSPDWYSDQFNIHWEYEIIGNIYENPKLISGNK